MLSALAVYLFLSIIPATYALPVTCEEGKQVPLPGFSNYYSDYRGKAIPYPGNETAAIMPTTYGPAAPDDLLWQNLASAEWIIFSYYQQAVENFNVSSFTDLGLPNTTYDRIQEVRDNEAGHLEVFLDSISSNSVKPGACKYDFGLNTAAAFVIAMPQVEIGSMAFLTGLVQQAKLNSTKGALTATSQTEARHEVFSLMGLFGANPFGGPTDTSFPYANEILQTLDPFVLPGSCPAANPIFPTPRQSLAPMSYNNTVGSLGSGDPIQFVFGSTVPHYVPGKIYYAVFFHGLVNVTMAFDPKTNLSRIPQFEKNRGLLISVIADEPGAPTLESVVAGPLMLTEQPMQLRKYGGSA